MIILLSIQIVLILYNNFQIFSPILCIMFSLLDVALWSTKACSSNAELIYLFLSLELLVSYLRTSHLIKVMKIYSIFLCMWFRNIIHLSSFLCALWRRDPILFFFRLISNFLASFVLTPLSKITDHKPEGLFTALFYLYFILILAVSFLITYFFDYYSILGSFKIEEYEFFNFVLSWHCSISL